MKRITGIFGAALVLNYWHFWRGFGADRLLAGLLKLTSNPNKGESLL